MPVMDMGALLVYKSGMASLILSLLVASLSGVSMWFDYGLEDALVSSAVLTLVLWPLTALSMRVMDIIIDFLGDAITRYRARE
jgi:cytochrome b subunit of formate dehydrogenase